MDPALRELSVPQTLAGFKPFKGPTSDRIEACLLLKTTLFFSASPAVII